MRFYRDDRPDLWEEPEPEFRDDRLRELVDGLPRRQRHLVSRVYFGGVPLKQAAEEIRLSPKDAKRQMEIGLGRLQRALREED